MSNLSPIINGPEVNPDNKLWPPLSQIESEGFPHGNISSLGTMGEGSGWDPRVRPPQVAPAAAGSARPGPRLAQARFLEIWKSGT